MKRTSKQSVLAIIIGTYLIIGFQNCSQTQFSQSEDFASVAAGSGQIIETSEPPVVLAEPEQPPVVVVEPEPPVVVAEPEQPPVVQTPVYQNRVLNFSVNSTQNSKIDILFVIDNSGSMSQEQAKIAQVFSGFISRLSHLDWRVGITTTDNSSSGAKGSLLPYRNSKYFIDSKTADVNALFIEGIQRGTRGSGTETGLYSITNFLTKSKQAGSQEAQFLRADAILTTIVVTDSDQSQNANRTGTSNSYINPADFVAHVKSEISGKEYIHHSSIVLPGDNACKSQGEMFGTSYYDVSQLTGGISASICANNYASQFDLMARSIIDRVSEKTLDCVPVSDVIVKDPSGSHLSGFEVVGKVVKFTTALSTVGDYQIIYKCLQ